MVLTSVVKAVATATDTAARLGYSAPPGAESILGPISSLIKSGEARVLPPFLGARIVCRLPAGQIYYDSQLAVDTDGSRFHRSDNHGQSTTAWQPGNHSVDADVISYFSVPLPIFYDSRFQLRKGNVAAVIYHNILTFAVLADVGGANLGEGSLELHRQLRHERVVNRNTPQERFLDSGIPGGVITIVFPESGNANVAPQGASIRSMGLHCWRSLLLSTSGDFDSAPMAARSA